MALSADLARIFEIGVINTYPVYCSSTIYRGSAVGISSGYARALTAGDSFRGFADAQVNNSTGMYGAETVDVIESGKMQVTLTGVAITDVGKPVYMSDDGTFTLTQGSNSLVGKVSRYVISNTCIIEFGGLTTVSALAVASTTITTITTVAYTNTTGLSESVNMLINRVSDLVTNFNAFLGGIKG